MCWLGYYVGTKDWGMHLIWYSDMTSIQLNYELLGGFNDQEKLFILIDLFGFPGDVIWNNTLHYHKFNL